MLNDWALAHDGQLTRALDLDGKSVRDRLAQVVSFVAQETGTSIAVATVLTGEKQHEVPAARALLGRAPLDGTLTSADSGHAYHHPPRAIVESGGDGLLRLKHNTPAVRAAVPTPSRSVSHRPARGQAPAQP